MMGGVKDAKHKRMRVMLENAATFSDVEFLVGPERQSFLGLKAIFARASEVFSKMFFEAGFREQQAGPRTVVEVSDIQPAAFEQLHRWVYDIEIEFTAETVFGVLEAARKYIVEDLELCCRQWIASTARCPDGAVGLLAAASGGGWLEWVAALWGRAESFGAATLASPSIPLLRSEHFLGLLASSDISVPDELTVFQVAKAWANGAHRRGEDPAAAWRLVMEAEAIRFHLMDQRTFAQEVVVPGLLNKDQALATFVTMSLGTGPPREVSLLAKFRAVLSGVTAEDAPSCIEQLMDLRQEEAFPRTLAQCLVERAMADHLHVDEWVGMWSELWGALRAAGLRDECLRATVDYCQNVFEDEPAPDSLVGVWVCPTDTLSLVRILCKLNSLRKLAVLPLVKVLEVLVLRTEEGSHCCCEPAEAAQELVAHLAEVRVRCGHLAALQKLPGLRARLAEACGEAS